MITIIIIAIISSVVCYVYYLSHDNRYESVEETSELSGNKEEPLKIFPPEKLMDLNTTTVADRQRVYKRSPMKQMQFDELQRRAEASGDTDTLESIRLGTYNGPLPQIEADLPRLTLSKPNGNPDAPVQELEYFCIKDKGYHVSVWPKDKSFLDIVEFNIAGLSHRDNIDNYLGEFHGTLEPEPTNPYDSNAIKVLAPDGYHVGYVPKDMTEEVRKYTTLQCECFFYIGENDGIYYSDCFIILK